MIVDENNFELVDSGIDQNCFNCSVHEFNNLNLKNNLKIVNQNLRSFDANYDQFSCLMEQLKCTIDILILTETWFKDRHQSAIEGYKGYHSVRSVGRGGGCSVYVRRELISNIVRNLTINENCIESVCVTVKIGSMELSILGIYRPPQCDINQFNDRLSEYLSMFSSNRNVLVGGDLNIDLLASNIAHPETINIFNSYNYLPYITKPTRITDTSVTCIDHFWYNECNVEVSGVLGEGDISDHNTVFIILKFKTDQAPLIKQFRDHSEACISRLKIEMSFFIDNMYHNISTNMDIHAKCEYFIQQFYSIYNKCCPIRSKQISFKSLKNPWIDTVLANAIKQKFYLFANYKRGIATFNEYNQFKNALQTKIRQAKMKYFKYKFEQTFGDIKKTWQSINRYFLNRESKTNIASLIDDDISYNASEDIGNIFSTYFSSIARTLDTNIPTSSDDPLKCMNNPQFNSFFVRFANEHEVCVVLSKMKNKNCNLLDIPSYIVKRLSSLVSPLLADIFNMSVISGSFPDCLKFSTVVPVFKKGNPKLKENYRPISTISIFSKLIEKLMCNRIVEFLDKYDILYNYQFGFRKGFSTSDAVLKFVDECSESFNCRKYQFAVMLDFSKAFDTVNHSVLLRKLEYYGFRGRSLRWISSYLKNRQSRVRINNFYSPYRFYDIGVPQGSILGPILFILYINDLHKTTDNLQFIHYADDTSVLISGNDLAITSNILNDSLSLIDQWLISNRLSLNISKTSYLLFTHNPVQNNYPVVKIRDSPISRVNVCRFLGVDIDDRLSFYHHVSNIVNKISRCNGAMFRASTYVNYSVLRSLYFSLVYPYMSYCVNVWGGSSVGNVKMITASQNRALKLLYKCNPDSSIMNFQDVYRYSLAITSYRYFVLKLSQYFCNKMDELIPSHNHNTRFDELNRLNLPRYTKTVCQKNFFYQSVVTWNSLPLKIRSATSLNKFKTELKKYLLSSWQNF